MHRSTQRILTTHVGSLPRPGNLAAALVALDRGTLSEEDEQALPARIREGVSEIVKRQAEVGIDVVSDGEVSKYGYSTYVKQRLTGLEGESIPLVLSDVEAFPDFSMKVALDVTNPSCTGAVAYRGHGALRVDLENMDRATRETQVTGAFLNAATPGIIADYQPNRYYDTDEEYLYALGDAMKEEYDAITEAGYELQLDAPDLALGRHLSNPPMSVEDFRRKISLRVDVINHATRDIDPAQLRLHICWGNYDGPHVHDVPLAEIIDIILGARAQTLLFEAANPRHEHEWEVFESIDIGDKLLVPGVIDTLTTYVEHPELVAQRIIRYGRAVSRENVMAGTDCGFATFADFLLVHPDIAWAKLNALVEGAEIASRALWK